MTVCPQAHPLSVHVRVPTEAAGRPVQFRLTWFPALRLVTARCGDPADDAALARLFDGDDGLAAPSEAAHWLPAASWPGTLHAPIGPTGGSENPRGITWISMAQLVSAVPS